MLSLLADYLYVILVRCHERNIDFENSRRKIRRIPCFQSWFEHIAGDLRFSQLHGSRASHREGKSVFLSRIRFGYACPRCNILDIVLVGSVPRI